MSIHDAVVRPPARGLPLIIDGSLRIPPGIVDLESFRRWARSEACPERVRLAYLGGTLWIDQTPEELYTHNQVKAEVAAGLAILVKDSQCGRYIPEGMLLSNPAADMSAVPDGLYTTYAAIRKGQLREIPGRHADVIELEGTPDMVLEVVSESSVEKDMVRLPELYRRAGIPEFWRIDARGELRFEILRLTDTGYVPAQEADGWWRSEVFNRSVQMVQQPDPLGQPQFTLAVHA